VSFPPELDARIEAAAAAAGVTVSAWIARLVEDRLISEEGMRAMAEYENLFGAFTAEELAVADASIDEAAAVAKRTYEGIGSSRVPMSTDATSASAADLGGQAKIAALDAYLAELERELGPIPDDERAAAKEWAARVLTPKQDRVVDAAPSDVQLAEGRSTSRGAGLSR
jgi:hypothetical protein